MSRIQFNTWLKASALLLVTGSVVVIQGCGGGGSAPTVVVADVTPADITPSETCESLMGLKVGDTTVTAAQSVPAGTYQPPGSAASFSNLPAFCRVTALATPVPGSSTSMELWLPSKGWNGRYMQVGTHGFGGTIFWNEMAPQLQRGFVAGAGDSGHKSTGGFDPSWFFGNSERLTDYAWRSVHEVAAGAKQIIQAYYGKPASYSYHNGCSTGGREGLKSAQMFPNDFNGILAGGTIQDFTRAGTQMYFTNRQLLQSGFQGTAGTALLNLVQKTAVAACDAADGVTDGIVRDPRSCHWDPHAMLCSAGQDPSTCLSAAQADAVAASIAPLSDPATHQVLFPGQAATSQLDWVRFGLNLGPFSYSLALYQMGLNDPKWDGSTFNISTDLPRMEAVLGVVNATNPDLSAFKTAGGKLIMFEGWEDGVTVPESSVQYYDAVRDTTAGGDRTVQMGFNRLFMMPGVSHCGGGSGPYNFGQEGQTAVSTDSAHDAVTALQAWTERGAAPDQFIATKFKNNDPTQGIAMQRPICAYPRQAVYKGTGDTNDASNFVCQ